jgi:hypothetical protein
MGMASVNTQTTHSESLPDKDPDTQAILMGRVLEILMEIEQITPTERASIQDNLAGLRSHHLGLGTSTSTQSASGQQRYVSLADIIQEPFLTPLMMSEVLWAPWMAQSHSMSFHPSFPFASGISQRRKPVLCVLFAQGALMSKPVATVTRILARSSSILVHFIFTTRRQRPHKTPSGGNS